MTSSQTFVIVGAGLAGAKAAEALREQGHAGDIVLLGAEKYRPYERPPLSKSYLNGSSKREEAFVHPESWYREHEVDVHLGQPVTGIDRSGQLVRTVDGTEFRYDKLLLSTGAGPRRLTVPGADGAGVHYLRSLDDSDELRAVLSGAGRLVVIGAGWIGLEVTAAARIAGVAVSVVESAPLPLFRVLGPELAEVFVGLHRERGVEFHFNAVVQEIVVVDGHAKGVRLADGTVLDADAVVVAVGVAPNADLASAAGLQVDNGVLVDAALRSSDPDVFAAGDLANAWHPFYDKRIRVEHWANALTQPAVAAASMLGRDGAYDELPYFYTDQYDLGMEYVGYVEPDGYDQLAYRGEPASREFIAFWLSRGRVIAGMNVNVWDVTDPIKAIIRSRAVVDLAALTDADTPLNVIAEGLTD
ncbi:MAG: pyridine nucleotide-disulfide oxidoreductase [Frankiales bacterium]|nr:pyridine nucleotide-disulfide oxidoreductase [Frankiales bacterium]